jgi:hypothetical protein
VFSPESRDEIVRNKLVKIGHIKRERPIRMTFQLDRAFDNASILP